eukprot:939711-Pyramimonas_sp.AAC.1
MDLSPGRQIVYRADSIGWVKTRIVDPDRGPMQYAPRMPAGATAKATPTPKPETIDLPLSS